MEKVMYATFYPSISHNFRLDARIKKAMSHIPIGLAKMGVGLEAWLVPGNAWEKEVLAE